MITTTLKETKKQENYISINSISNTSIIPLLSTSIYSYTLLFTLPSNNESEKPCSVVIMVTVEDDDGNSLPENPPHLNPVNLEEVKRSYTNRIINSDTIYTFAYLKETLRDYVPVKLLSKVHANKEVAVEVCMLFASQFVGQIYKYRNFDTLGVSLCAEFLKITYGDNYKRIIDVLMYDGNGRQVIACNNHFSEGVSYVYYLTPMYLEGGIRRYKIKTKQLKQLRGRMINSALSRAESNVIARNTLIFYSSVTLPTEKELLSIGTKMVKNKETKKGKLYKKLGKKKRVYKKEWRYIEDDIELFEYLTQPSFLIPTESENAGGRVAHSFNLIPTWIRNEVMSNGKKLFEADFSALHPNIASAIYGNRSSVTHEEIAFKMDIDKDVVKIEHLSFFNKKIWQMKKSPLWNYYMENQSSMINKICQEKMDDSYKVTCKVMFTKEVEMMTESIEFLNGMGIYPMYVYDALYGTEEEIESIQQVMQMVADSFGIPTKANLK